jgi:tetratricopeptide (TPR) repeat protein
MNRNPVARRLALVLVFILALAAPVAAQRPAEHAAEPGFENLKILPKDISRADLLALMGTFTRGLGVRCGYCHVTEQEKPDAKNRFALDDKPTKAKARIMMTMTHDLNEKYLTQLATREKPAINVQCVTCHRGITEPRTLPDVLVNAYDTGGLDSTMARYGRLRDRYYGSAAYNFSEASLSEAATRLDGAGHGDDAMVLLAKNVEMNPTSVFAKRQHAQFAVGRAFDGHGADAGAAEYHAMKDKYGDAVVNDELLNEVGYHFLGLGNTQTALAIFKFNVAEYPQSANAYDSLAEGYSKSGDRKLALATYKKSLALDPKNENAKQWIEELSKKPKK